MCILLKVVEAAFFAGFDEGCAFYFIRCLTSSLFYFDKIIRDFVRGNLQSNNINP